MMARTNAIGVAATGRLVDFIAASLARFATMVAAGVTRLQLIFPSPSARGSGEGSLRTETGDEMPTLASKLNPRSEEFKAHAATMRALVDDLNAKLARIGQGR